MDPKVEAQLLLYLRSISESLEVLASCKTEDCQGEPVLAIYNIGDGEDAEPETKGENE